jgi:acetylornithine deacetylase
MSEVIELLWRLVSIDSVNPNLVPGAAGEGEIAAFVRDWLTARGAETTWLEATPGRAAHGSRPDLGIDAVSHMGRVLGAVERLNEELSRGPTHPLLDHASLHASTIEGGEGWSTYPAQCRLRLEWRTLPGDERDDVARCLTQLLAGLAATDPTFQGELRLDLWRPPYEIDPRHDLTGTVAEAAARVLGVPPATTGVAYWADTALLGKAGIPTVMFGPSGTGAHATEEWVDLESVETCANVLELAIRSYCA